MINALFMRYATALTVNIPDTTCNNYLIKLTLPIGEKRQNLDIALSLDPSSFLRKSGLRDRLMKFLLLHHFKQLLELSGST